MKRPRRAKRLRQMADRTLLLRDRRPPPEPVTQPIRRHPQPDPGLYQTAPAGPTRLPPQTDDEPTIRTHQAGAGVTMQTYEDVPGPIPINKGVRAALQYIELEVADIEFRGMGYRIDAAERDWQCGVKPGEMPLSMSLSEELEEQDRMRIKFLAEHELIAETVAKAKRHLMSSREPWEPAGWDYGVGTQPQPAAAGPVVDVAWPDTDPSGWRATIQRELGGDAA